MGFGDVVAHGARHGDLYMFSHDIALCLSANNVRFGLPNSYPPLRTCTLVDIANCLYQAIIWFCCIFTVVSCEAFKSYPFYIMGLSILIAKFLVGYITILLHLVILIFILIALKFYTGLLVPLSSFHFES